MTDYFQDLLVAFETHSVEQIRAILASGIDVTLPIHGKTPINWLIEMYFRSDQFPECLRLLLERGASLDDPKIEAVLLNDEQALELAVRKDPMLLEHRSSLNCAFTPLFGASLLHIAAEYGNLAVVNKLLELGVPVDIRAATDDDGMNGHTPIFHTVNSNANRSKQVMDALLLAGARTDIQLRGVTWGRGFDWETTFLDVTPISYAQLGLMPQMHRSELDIYSNLQKLLVSAGRSVPGFKNVPNRYLNSG